MKSVKLGQSELRVSEICLGTMTFGQQNSLADAKDQLDYAVDRGVNFIDTAEMYLRAQLAENLDSAQLSLSPEISSEIEQVHARFPNPAP